MAASTPILNIGISNSVETFGNIVLKNFGGRPCKSVNGLVLISIDPFFKRKSKVFLDFFHQVLKEIAKINKRRLSNKSVGM